MNKWNRRRRLRNIWPVETNCRLCWWRLGIDGHLRTCLTFVAKYTCAESTNSGGERNRRMWSLIPFTSNDPMRVVAVCRCTIIIELQCLTSLKKTRSLVRRSRKEFLINASNEGTNQQTNATFSHSSGLFLWHPEEFVNRAPQHLFPVSDFYRFSVLVLMTVSSLSHLTNPKAVL